MSDFSWEFACPKYVDFTNSAALDANADEADKYFETEHEFSFSVTTRRLSEKLKVETLLAEAESKESMSSPSVTPSRPTSSASNYRTPDSCDLENDEVFYTTRKSYSLRETECRRLTQIGASPYRIPGGTTTGKKRARRTPFQPKLIEENSQQVEEEEILAETLKKALFLDSESELVKDKDEVDNAKISNEDKVERIANGLTESGEDRKSDGERLDHSMELQLPLAEMSEDDDKENIETVLAGAELSEEKRIRESEKEPISSQEDSRLVGEKLDHSMELEIPREKTFKKESEDDKEIIVDVTEVPEEGKVQGTEQELIIPQEDCESVEGKLDHSVASQLPSNETFNADDKEIVINGEELEREIKVTETGKANLEENTKSIEARLDLSMELLNPCEKSKESNEKNIEIIVTGPEQSDDCWTDADDHLPGPSDTQGKPRRPLRRRSFVKSSATLASTAQKVDPQKRLYRLLSFTAPPKNKYKSLAELSRDFEQKIRNYTPPILKRAKSQWTPTKPVSPKLTACKRVRKSTCISAAEKEENIAQNIMKNTFKATPFNKKTYLSTANVGVKRVEPRPTTKPIPFSFRSEKRIEARRSKLPTDLFNKHASESAKKAN